MYEIHLYSDHVELWKDGEWIVIKPTHSLEESKAWAAKWYPNVQVK